MFLLNFSPIYVLSHIIEDFVVTVIIKPKTDTTQTRFSKYLAKSLLWSGPYKMPNSVLLVREFETW